MRQFLLALLLAVLTAMPIASGQSFIIEKPAFRDLVPDDATVEKLAGRFRFVEGPAWDVAGGFLVFSDIPADKMYRYDPTTRAVTVFREPSRHANGNCYDLAGKLYTCEHGSRAIRRLEVFSGGYDMQAEMRVAEQFGGKRLNSPNDIVAKSDGTIWFTDPTYGLEGATKEQAANNVYRLDPTARELHAVATDFIQPNGLCFSPDEKLLYIADSDQPQHIRVFDVTADNRLTSDRVFCRIDNGAPDGIRCDRHGNVWSSAGDGIHIFAPDGTRLGKILVPETPANLCFGGRNGDELFITAQTSLYHVRVATTGAGQTGPGSAPASTH